MPTSDIDTVFHQIARLLILVAEITNYTVTFRSTFRREQSYNSAYFSSTGNQFIPIRFLINFIPISLTSIFDEVRTLCERIS